MKKRKKIRERGKARLSKIFQEFKKGDKVALIRNLSQKGMFPKRFHGLTGIVEDKKGRAYIVKFLNGKRYKRLTIKPAHLKKLKG